MHGHTSSARWRLKVLRARGLLLRGQRHLLSGGDGYGLLPRPNGMCTGWRPSMYGFTPAPRRRRTLLQSRSMPLCEQRHLLPNGPDRSMLSGREHVLRQLSQPTAFL
jgi:hypothetical protein